MCEEHAEQLAHNAQYDSEINQHSKHLKQQQNKLLLKQQIKDDLARKLDERNEQ